MLSGRQAVAFVTRPILALKQEADRLGEKEAQGKADHDPSEALVVSGRVSPVGRVRTMNAHSTGWAITPEMQVCTYASNRRAPVILPREYPIKVPAAYTVFLV